MSSAFIEVVEAYTHKLDIDNLNEILSSARIPSLNIIQTLKIDDKLFEKIVFAWNFKTTRSPNQI